MPKKKNETVEKIFGVKSRKNCTLINCESVD